MKRIEIVVDYEKNNRALKSRICYQVSICTWKWILTLSVFLMLHKLLSFCKRRPTMCKAVSSQFMTQWTADRLALHMLHRLLSSVRR